VIELKVVEGNKAEIIERTGGIFTGTVKITSLLDRDKGSDKFRAAIVTFPPGVRNHFHTHTHDQILYVVGGSGIVATEKDEWVVNRGDIIMIPAGESHWHGATDESEFSHLFVIHNDSKTSY
jgi:quercetin dioxygenase-like cupin family protein